MHAAPSVNYPVGRSAFAGWAAALAALAGLLAAGAWAWQSPVVGWRHAVAFLAVLACALVALRGWRLSAHGTLRWDGAGWQWEEGTRVTCGQPEIALDLQVRALLRWTGDEGGVRWFWVERKSDASHWDALRRAVYSRASAPIPTFPETGKESPPAGKPPAAEQ
jgi:toxin CptA